MLDQTDWSSLAGAVCDVESALQQLNTNLMGAIDALAPVKRLLPKKRRPPWVGAELRRALSTVRTAKRRARRSGSPNHRDDYHRLRDLVNLRIEEAKKEFLQRKLSEALENNTIWKELRDLGLLPKKKGDLNGFSPDELNQHFAAVSISQDEKQIVLNDLIATASEDGFKFSEVTMVDVVLAIRHFSSQAVGEDGIPQSVILKALPTIGKFITRIFNESLTSGTFPVLWKKARVIPLKNCSAPTSFSDYRPIAILSFLSKVLEKTAHQQVADYLELRGILSPMQSGFCPHYSTQTALLRITDDIRFAKDRGEITLLLQFDFSKAFDKVSPGLLIEKLKALGFSRPALMWLRSYLTVREQ